MAYENDGSHEDASHLFGSAVTQTSESPDEVDGTGRRFVVERFMIPEADAAKDALKALIGNLRNAGEAVKTPVVSPVSAAVRDETPPLSAPDFQPISSSIDPSQGAP